MRRKKKEIADRAIIVELLQQCAVGRLGTIGRDAYPMVKPLNFVCNDRKIYFHSAMEGEKIEDIKRDNRVCFEADLAIAFLKAKTQPCEAAYLYRSVIIKGRAFIVDSKEEKVSALRLLMDKYQPGGNMHDFPEAKLDLTAVVRIDIEEMTGKEDVGKEAVKTVVLKALEDKTPMPFVLDR